MPETNQLIFMHFSFESHESILACENINQRSVINKVQENIFFIRCFCYFYCDLVWRHITFGVLLNASNSLVFSSFFFISPIFPASAGVFVVVVVKRNPFGLPAFHLRVCVFPVSLSQDGFETVIYFKF